MVDALVSGTSGSNTLEVRVFLSAPFFIGVVAQLIERYVRIVEVVGLSPISSTKFSSLRGYGGMVDAEDLKSFGHCDRVGSSPTIPTILRQRLRMARHNSPQNWRFFVRINTDV